MQQEAWFVMQRPSFTAAMSGYQSPRSGQGITRPQYDGPVKPRSGDKAMSATTAMTPVPVMFGQSSPAMRTLRWVLSIMPILLPLIWSM